MLSNQERAALLEPHEPLSVFQKGRGIHGITFFFNLFPWKAVYICKTFLNIPELLLDRFGIVFAKNMAKEKLRASPPSAPSELICLRRSSVPSISCPPGLLVYTSDGRGTEAEEKVPVLIREAF